MTPNQEISVKTVEKINDLEKRINTKLDTKISNKSFWSVNGLLVMFMCLMFGLLWDSTQNMNNKIDNIENKTDETNITVSNIEGKLEPFDFIIE